MTNQSPKKTGGQLFVDALSTAGINRVFCVPGESFLAALDALYDAQSIDVIQCRHESGAGLMAVADARMTQCPAVCMVTRGPGAANAALAVHVAEQDAVPLVLVIGQVERANLRRGAFQEVDYGKTFSDMAKWVVEVQDPARIPEFMSRAWHEATSGTPGPVVVVVPEDVWADRGTASGLTPHVAARPEANPEQLATVAARIARAERPIILAGGDCESPDARAVLLAMSEAYDIPVAATNKRQHVFPNDHPNWIGHIGYIVAPQISRLLSEADLVIAAGSRLGDVSTQGFKFPAVPVPSQDLIHIHPDPAVIGRNHQTQHAIVSDTAAALNGLIARAPEWQSDTSDWIDRLARERDQLASYTPSEQSDGIDFGFVAQSLAQALDANAILTADAGNFTSWMHAMVRLGSGNEFLGSVGGAMGFAVPSAVAAAARYPDRQVVCLVGDGGMLMTGYELATAQMLGLAPKIFVANNSSYGVIRSHQEKAYPRRVIGTALTNPDFAALGRSFGATGLTIDTPQEADRITRDALNMPGMVVVDVKTSLTKLNLFQNLPG